MITSVLRSLLLVGALALTALSPTLFAERVSGSWHMQIVLDASSGSAYLQLEQDGETLRGGYQGLLGRSDVTGTLRVNEIAFTVTSGGQTITYSGTIEDGAMSGRCDYAGATVCTFRGIRLES
ncbi:MAG: hypothetical protein SH809_08660 [Rhodothermales bacterium]|nr:hypothetical protein [Rhodothermales bacterium]